MAKWETLAKYKKLGAWGLKYIMSFSKALTSKSPWRCVEDPGLWGSLVKSKYLKDRAMFKWFGMGMKMKKKPQTFESLLLGKSKLLQLVLVGRLLMGGRSPLTMEFGSMAISSIHL